MQVTETSTEGLKREFRVVVTASDLSDRVADRLVAIHRSGGNSFCTSQIVCGNTATMNTPAVSHGALDRQ